MAISNCVFCDILSGRTPASFVYRDAVAAVFMDIRPVNPGHLLVVAVRHAAYLDGIDGDTAGHLMRVAHLMCAALRRSSVQCEGLNLFLADGEAAMQEVFHVHLHVIPRFRDDGFGLHFAPRYYGPQPHRVQLDTIATELSALVPDPANP